jgi:hypothetical protein
MPAGADVPGLGKQSSREKSRELNKGASPTRPGVSNNAFVTREGKTLTLLQDRRSAQ